jgi:glutaconate CoA-transferase subunit A
MLGTDYISDRYYPQPNGFLGKDKLHVMESPFGDGREKVVLLPALRPDVSCVHVQWADEDGNAAFWGGAGEVRWGLWASERIVISAEEIVPRSVFRSDPGRVTIPGFRVNAVVHLPHGALPWGVPGYYRGEPRLTGEYMIRSRDEAGFKQLIDEWVERVPEHEMFLTHFRERFGEGALEALKANRTWEPERGIRYGWSAST